VLSQLLEESDDELVVDVMDIVGDGSQLSDAKGVSKTFKAMSE